MINIRAGVIALLVFRVELFLALFCFLFILFTVTQNCLQMTTYYLQQCIILAKQQMI